MRILKENIIMEWNTDVDKTVRLAMSQITSVSNSISLKLWLQT